ncbi:acyl-CoA 6-desaturase-like [Ctenodactylus gundi]
MALLLTAAGSHHVPSGWTRKREQSAQCPGSSALDWRPQDSCLPQAMQDPSPLPSTGAAPIGAGRRRQEGLVQHPAATSHPPVLPASLLPPPVLPVKCSSSWSVTEDPRRQRQQRTQSTKALLIQTVCGGRKSPEEDRTFTTGVSLWDIALVEVIRRGPGGLGRVEAERAGERGGGGEGRAGAGSREGTKAAAGALGRGPERGRRRAAGMQTRDTGRGRPLRAFSWAEVREHGQRTDRWIVVGRRVYDVTGWSRHHPGGSRVLTHFAGQDATDAFAAFHPRQARPRAALRALLVGQLRPEEPDGAGDPSNAVTRDFRALRRAAEAQGLFRPRHRFFLLLLAHILALEAAAALIAASCGSGWLPALATALVLATSQTQLMWLQHDYGHLSVYRKSSWNHLAHRFLMGHLKGASATWWNHRHFQHHAKTNVLYKDPDLRVADLFVLGERQPLVFGRQKVKHLPYNLQHGYLFLFTPLLIPVFFQYDIFRIIVLRRDWRDLAWVISFYVRFFCTYAPFYGLLGATLLLTLVRVLESHWFVWVSQMNHIVMDVDWDRHRDWFSSQLAATCNVEQSFFNDWFTGHLNFQIEHHLFPTMPRHNLHKVAPLVKALCAKHGIEYKEKPLLRAMGDIIRSLKRSGQLWLDAYLQD